MRIGAQLFTVREFCRTLDGLDETMKRVADIGYTSIQLSAVCPYEPDWMAERLKAYGLTADLTHFDYNRIVNDTANTIAFHDKMSCRYIGLGFGPKGFDADGLAALTSELSSALPQMAAAGHKFMYHNHNMEFAHLDGKTFLDRLCDAFSPDQLGVTLDCYWVQAAGGDPVQWIRRLKGRVDCIHLKDMVYSAEDKGARMAVVGEGNMNYPAILDTCLEEGVSYAFVEQDNCYGEDPFACLKRSYEYLRAQGLH